MHERGKKFAEIIVKIVYGWINELTGFYEWLRDCIDFFHSVEGLDWGEKHFHPPLNQT
jgi:hypothetical protein